MSNKSINLLTTVTETPEESSTLGVTVIRIGVAGEPHASAIYDAVLDTYHRHVPDDDILMALARDRAKVTIVTHGENYFGAGLINGEEVTLFEGRSGVGYLPKGARSKGFQLQSHKLLDLIDGWHIDEARRRVDAVRSRFPATLVELTQERLEQLPQATADGRSADCSLVVFGTCRTPEGNDVQAMWFCTEYDPEDDIVDGVLIVRPQYGESEHGSCYGRDLLRFGGEVVGAPVITFKQALELCDTDHADALDLIANKQTA